MKYSHRFTEVHVLQESLYGKVVIAKDNYNNELSAVKVGQYPETKIHAFLALTLLTSRF